MLVFAGTSISANDAAVMAESSGNLDTINTGDEVGAAPIGASSKTDLSHFAVWLPDPTIGGKPSYIRNGFATGQQSTNQIQATPTGQVAPGVPLSNPVVGEVGLTSRATRQYLGVMNQLSSYGGSSLPAAAASVGIQLQTRGTNYAG